MLMHAVISETKNGSRVEKIGSNTVPVEFDSAGGHCSEPILLQLASGVMYYLCKEALCLKILKEMQLQQNLPG